MISSVCLNQEESEQSTGERAVSLGALQGSSVQKNYIFTLTLLAMISIVSSARAELNIDCTTLTETAYFGANTSQPIEVVNVDGVLISKQILPAFAAMHRAALGDGVSLTLVSGFRTMERQRYLHNCYMNRNEDQCPEGCSSCNVAATPGTSSHQTGTAIDLETNGGTNQAYQWLRNHAYDYGFNDNYNPPEPWHWVYQYPKTFPDPCAPNGLVEYSPTCASADVEGAVSRFKDVLPSMTGSDAVELIFEAGITRGCSDRHFCPNCLTTRAMMVTFVMRALGVAPDAHSASRFTDVPESSYYLPYVEAAAEMGIINGCDSNRFCPDEHVTRAQAAKILINAIGAPVTSSSTSTFTDVDPAHWSSPFIEALNTYCITTGCAPGHFCPNDPIPRINAALFIARAFDLQDYNECISRCDRSLCHASDFCEPWSQCTTEDICSVSGETQRICHEYECVGSEMDSSCESTTRTELNECITAVSTECNMDVDIEIAGDSDTEEAGEGEAGVGEVSAGEAEADKLYASHTVENNATAASSSCHSIGPKRSFWLLFLLFIPLLRSREERAS